MKRIPILSIFLTILVVTSLGLSYLLIFNTNPVLKFLLKESAEKVSVTNNQEQLNAYYQPSKPEFEDAIYPSSLYFSSGDQMYLVNHYATLQNIMVNLSNAPFEIGDGEVIKDRVRFEKIYERDYLEFDYNQAIPIVLLDKIILMKDDFETDFKVNRLIIPKNTTDFAYAVDTETSRFVELRVNRDLDILDVFNQITKVKNDWKLVDRYELKAGNVYLPVKSQKIPSQVYTLEKIPENLFISTVFPNSDFVISQANTDELHSYQNYQSTLTIYGNRQIMNITTNSVSKHGNLSEAGKIIESFKPVKEHAYWKQGVRYDGNISNTITYRRYLNGYPIYTPEAIEDYGELKVFMRNTPGAEIYRFEKPTVILQANVDDLSQKIEVLSGMELIATLQNAGFGLEQFDNIRLAYEWQPDMQNFQIATLIPKWYLEIGNKAYSLDQVKSGKLAEDLADNHNVETNNEGGE